MKTIDTFIYFKSDFYFIIYFEMQVPIWVSNRHVHLSREDAEKLFGEGYELTKIKDLSQPWQFAAAECVTLKWPKGQIEKVRILWPYRPQSQVEIFIADQFKLWSTAPIRLSGDLKNSAGVTIVAQDWKELVLEEWMIVAKRHIHMTPEDAKNYGVQNNQIVQIKCGWERWLIFDEVVIRVTETSTLDTHLDVEEANAACLAQWATAEILLNEPIRLYTSNTKA